jgi:hypothetical protein
METGRNITGLRGAVPDGVTIDNPELLEAKADKESWELPGWRALGDWLVELQRDYGLTQVLMLGAKDMPPTEAIAVQAWSRRGWANANIRAGRQFPTLIAFSEIADQYKQREEPKPSG